MSRGEFIHTAVALRGLLLMPRPYLLQLLRPLLRGVRGL